MMGKSSATECVPGMEEKGVELAILESLVSGGLWISVVEQCPKSNSLRW